MRKSFMCLNVESAIMHHSRENPEEWSGATEGEKKVSNQEFLQFLFTQHAEGKKVIPMNGKCANPCKQSDQCAGFDYSEEGGCPGYEMPETTSQAQGV